MKTLIKNGTLITASDTFKSDILIEDEKIIRIGLNLEADSDHLVDATGKLIMPGGVDPHVHFTGSGAFDATALAETCLANGEAPGAPGRFARCLV